MNQAEVAQALASDRPLSKLRGVLGGWERALLAHANFMERRYASLEGDHHCRACEVNFGHPTQVEWHAIYHTTSTALGTLIGAIFAIGGHGHLPYRRVKFSTFHSLCAACQRGVQFRRIGASLLDKLCFVVLLLSASAFVLSLLFAAILNTTMLLRELEGFLAILVGSAIIFALGVYGAHQSKLLPTPKTLRSIGKPPFTILKVHTSTAPSSK